MRVSLLTSSCLVALGASAYAEDLEPRRWSHIPVGMQSLSLAYVYTDADILFDPASRFEDVHMTMHVWAAKYLNCFDLLGTTARVELTQAYAFGRWTGKVDGVSGAIERDGLADSQVRFAMNLVGAPPLAGKAYQAYRAQPGMETIVGAAVIVHVPTGEYDSDRLINIGSNRFTIRPQLGVLHNWDNWSFEYTGSVWFFTDNNDFYNDSTLRQDPLYSAQAHVVYSINPGVWANVSGAYTYGGASTVNGDALKDPREQLFWSVGFGFPITAHLLAKCTYTGTYAFTEVGQGFESGTVGMGYLW
jgi:Putative MetA-pathway of phenol degradation